MLVWSLECQHLCCQEQLTLTLMQIFSSINTYCVCVSHFLIAESLICCMLAVRYSEDAWETVKQVRLNNPRAGAHRCNIN